MLHTSIFSGASFWLKVVAAVALVALADAFFVWHEPGTTLGVFALVWLAGVIATRWGLLRHGRSLAALAAALGFVLVLVDRPGPLAWCLFGLSLMAAVLSARVRSDEPAWNWAQRLIVHGVVSVFGPLIDLTRLSRLKGSRKGLSGLALIGRLIMPVAGGALFLGLFSAANPLISDFLDTFALPSLTNISIARGVVWVVVLIMVGASLRPRWRRKLIGLPQRKPGAPSPALTTSITWSLIVFNAVFALQNGLDIAFLWSGAPLPGDMGLAEYAHRGAYPLIVTALLAGLFVLIALQPGSDTARRPLVRRLVVVWIAQNMLLVASSLLRTADYIEAYALTRFRIAAMIWMVLVGVGLLLICWRMLRDKSAHWLIDANVVVALIVLSIVSALDLGAIAASWNVRHAREVGGRGVELDLAYLRSLGAPALVSLVELEQSTPDPVLRDRVASVRRGVLARVRWEQNEWRGWTWRNHRRLARVDALSRRRPLAIPKDGPRDEAGRLRPPPRPLPDVVMEPSPLTYRAGR